MNHLAPRPVTRRRSPRAAAGHGRAGSYRRSSARSDAGWGGESSNRYIADLSGVVTMSVLLLSRGDKDRGG